MTAWKFAVTLLGMWQLFRPLREIAAQAKQIAREQGSGVVTEEHLFLVALDPAHDAGGTIFRMLAASGTSREEARLYAQNALEIRPLKAGRQPRLLDRTHHVLDAAISEAGNNDNFRIEMRHLFIACVLPRRGTHLGQTLGPLGLDAALLREQLRAIRREREAGNPLGHLAPEAQQVLQAARAAMRASFCGRISAAHLLMGILSDGQEAVQALEQAGCDLEALKQRARNSVKSDGEIATPGFRFSPDAKRALERAAREAKRAKSRCIEPKHLLRGLLPARQTLGERWRAGSQTLDSGERLWSPALVAPLRDALRAALRSAPKREETQNARVARAEEFSSREAVRLRKAVSCFLWSIIALSNFAVFHLMLSPILFPKPFKSFVFSTYLTLMLVCMPLAFIIEGALGFDSRQWPKLGGILWGVALGLLWTHYH